MLAITGFRIEENGRDPWTGIDNMIARTTTRLWIGIGRLKEISV